MEVNRLGCTRVVLLTKSYAIKLPNFLDEWRLGLHGLLANMQEVQFSQTGWAELCPVLWWVPGGWCVVMPRVSVLTDEEFLAFQDAGGFTTKDYLVPTEAKSDSYGWLNGRIVAIDYGN